MSEEVDYQRRRFTVVNLFPDPKELIWTAINLLMPVGFVLVVVGVIFARRRVIRSLEDRVARLESRVDAMERASSGSVSN